MKQVAHFVPLSLIYALLCPAFAQAQANTAAQASSWWNPAGAAAGQIAGSAWGTGVAGGEGLTSTITGGVGYVAGGLGLWGGAQKPAASATNPSEAAANSAGANSSAGNLGLPAALPGSNGADSAEAFNALAQSAPGAIPGVINAMTRDQFAAAAQIPRPGNPSPSAQTASPQSGITGTAVTFSEAQIAQAQKIAAQVARQARTLASSFSGDAGGYENVAATARKMGGTLSAGSSNRDYAALAQAQAVKQDSLRQDLNSRSAGASADFGMDGEGVSIIDGNTANRDVVRVAAKRGMLSRKIFVPVGSATCDASHPC